MNAPDRELRADMLAEAIETVDWLTNRSASDRELLAALDDHALWMILHYDECESDACEGCIDGPAPEAGESR
jgi:hypothetical protein